ncbi:hypothetical protein MNBD_ACTINO02-1062 [hydrothermal vent metagenome]|uniref:Uncharacterized protein n=1 Tax=hydrothermal vent metagenome TaxID=652676 RepID=A0A3B0TC60_9ZZZZ
MPGRASQTLSRQLGRVTDGAQTVTAQTVVKALVGGAFLVVVLAGCQTEPNSPPTSEGYLTAVDAEQLPDGTDIEIEGVIVAQDGATVLATVPLDFFPPSYNYTMDLYDVDIDTLDMVAFPPYTTRWSDKYLVSGTIRNGDLYAKSIMYLRPNRSRPVMDDCRAATDDPANLGTCPEWMFEYYSGDSGG